MSRTITHLPYEVKILGGYVTTVDQHDHCGGTCQIQTLQDWQQRFGPRLPGQGHGSWGRWHIPCSQGLPYYQLPRHFVRNMPRDYRRMGFEKPARQRARSQLHAARRDFNAHGYTNLEVEPYKHNHQALWTWY